VKKTINSFLFLVCLFQQVQGQINKGVTSSGGGINFYSRNIDRADGNAKQTNFSFAPNISYFLAKNLSLGIEVGYSYENSSNSSISPGPYIESTSKSFSVGPFIRYYKMLNEHVSLFGQASFTVGFPRNEVSNFQSGGFMSTNNYRTIQLVAGLQPGITFFITKRLALEGSYGFIGYRRQQQKSETGIPTTVTDNSESSFELSFNPSSLGLGLQYYFSR
jgi:hypothetical protein